MFFVSYIGLGCLVFCCCLFPFVISTLSFSSAFSLFLGNPVLLYQDLVFVLFCITEKEKKKKANIGKMSVMSLCLIDKFFS